MTLDQGAFTNSRQASPKIARFFGNGVCCEPGGAAVCEQVQEIQASIERLTAISSCRFRTARTSGGFSRPYSGGCEKRVELFITGVRISRELRRVPVKNSGGFSSNALKTGLGLAEPIESRVKKAWVAVQHLTPTFSPDYWGEGVDILSISVGVCGTATAFCPSLDSRPVAGAIRSRRHLDRGRLWLARRRGRPRAASPACD